jgi:hypothetical protein
MLCIQKYVQSLFNVAFCSLVLIAAYLYVTQLYDENICYFYDNFK